MAGLAGRWVALRARLPIGAMGGASLLLIGAQVVTAVLGYVFWLLSARAAVPQTIGEVGALLSLLSLVLVVATAGIGATMLVELPRRDGCDADRLLSASLLFAVLVGGVTLAVLVAVDARLGLWPLLQAPWVVPLLAVSVLFASVTAVLDVAALSRGASQLVLVRAAVTSGVRLLLLLASLAAGAALSTRMMLVLWAASLVAAVLTLSGLRRRVGLRLTGRGVWAELWWLVGRLRWNQVGALAARVPPLSLPLLVTWRAGAEANAGFFLSWQLAGGVFMVTAAVSQAFLAEAGDGTALAHRTARAVRLQLLLGVPALVGVAVVGPFVLGLLGEVYAAASVTLLVLVASAPALAVVSLAGARLRAQRRDGAAAALNVVSGVTTLPLALWWVGSFGPSGVAAAFAVSQTFGAVLGLVLARRPFVGAS